MRKEKVQVIVLLSKLKRGHFKARTELCKSEVVLWREQIGFQAGGLRCFGGMKGISRIDLIEKEQLMENTKAAR